MRIKKIEVTGFKSFADRQVFLVDDRVTGVIGPNGCGKSCESKTYEIPNANLMITRSSNNIVIT